MIVGKNSAFEGFGWFAKSGVKLLSAAALMSLGVWGIIIGSCALVIFGCESWNDFIKLSKPKDAKYKVNEMPVFETKDNSDGYYGEFQTPNEK